jgi:membrane carboxypeptidase/penicillin-binding protein
MDLFLEQVPEVQGALFAMEVQTEGFAPWRREDFGASQFNRATQANVNRVQRSTHHLRGSPDWGMTPSI